MHHRLSQSLSPRLSLLGAVVLGLACSPAAAQTRLQLDTPTALTATANPALPGEIVFMLRSSADLAGVAAGFNLTIVDQFGQRPIYRAKLPRRASVERTLGKLRRDRRVQFAEPNFENQTPESRHQVVWAVGGDAGVYATQWVPQALALPQAHATSIGQGVRVAILDTGIDATHPALASRMARNAGGTVLGRDFVDADTDASEAGSPVDPGWGHGTHVAGLVALAAPGAQLMPARVLEPSGRGNLWVLAEALLWAVDPDANPTTADGAQVINLSLGTTRKTNLLDTVVGLVSCEFDDDDDETLQDPGFDDDRERCGLGPGAVVMAAAGNAGSTTELQYPAAEAAKGQLAVTAHDEASQLASFANRGSWVQLAAPGASVVSTMPGGGYATWSGTSMASPLAAGVAALLRSLQPDLTAEEVAKRLADRSRRLCGDTDLRGLNAHGVVADFTPEDTVCPP